MLGLDATTNAITLRYPMNARIAVLILSICAAPFLAVGARAAVVFGPGSKAPFHAPGEEEMSGTALELFHIGQEAEKQGNYHKAIKAYRAIVRKHGRDAIAPGAAYRAAELYEQLKDYSGAADSYRYLVERYPTNPHFEDAIEGQFRIGEMFLNGKKVKMLGLSWGNSIEKAVEIFASIIRTAPYGRYRPSTAFVLSLVLCAAVVALYLPNFMRTRVHTAARMKPFDETTNEFFVRGLNDAYRSPEVLPTQSLIPQPAEATNWSEEQRGAYNRGYVAGRPRAKAN